MDTINRTLAIVKPREPYVEWARTVSDPIDISLKELRRDCTTVLLPDVATDTEAEAALRAISHKLFAIELAAWDTDEDDWPQQRDYATFRAWFDIELHSVVLDSVSAPIQHEHYEIS